MSEVIHYADLEGEAYATVTVEPDTGIEVDFCIPTEESGGPNPVPEWCVLLSAKEVKTLVNALRSGLDEWERSA